MINLNKFASFYTALAEPVLKFLGGQGMGPAGQGIGGAVTQITSKSTTVILQKITGQITLNAANLAAAGIVTFTVTDALCELNDYVHAQHISGGTVGAYLVTAQAGAGSFTITVTNITAGGLAEAIVIQYYIYKLPIT